MSPKGNAKYVPQKSSSTTTYILGGIALVVIAVVVIGGVIWQNSRSKPLNEGYGTAHNAALQVQLLPDNTVRLGLPDAKTQIDVFEDPLCPACRVFEERYGQQLAQAVDEGKVAVHYRLIDFLNTKSSSKTYSTRAIAATLCVAESGNAAAFAKFHTELFSAATQPAEGGSSDYTEAQLADLAKEAGAPDSAVQCIASGTKINDAAAAAKAGIEYLQGTTGVATPTVQVDGKQVNVSDAGWIGKL